MVIDFDQFHVRGQRLANPLQSPLEAIGDLHGVGVALLVDGQFDRFATLDARNRLALLEAALHGGDVAQVDRALGDVSHDGVLELVHRLEFVQRANQEPLVAFLEPATGKIDVFRAYALRDLLDTDPELRQLLLVDLDLDLVLETTANLDGGGAFLGLEVGFYAIFPETPQGFQAGLRIV